ncbi:MAG: HlyC/CorC family transporter [Anaerolineales bacterium]|nr:HlyC/CorC family transporter [Anaerolineales bacterium]
MLDILAIIATVALMIFFNGLYVASEFATVAARRTRISQLAGQGNRMAQVLLPIVEDRQLLDRYIAACQLGITISSLVLGAYGQNVVAVRLEPPLIDLLGRFGVETAVSSAAAQSIAATGVLLFLTILQVLMGELFPKSVAVQYPESVALAVVVPMKWSLTVLRPLIWLFNGSGSLVLRLLGYNTKDKAPAHSPEEIELLMTESHEVGLLDDRERQMLRNAFRLRDLTARQVMLHRTKLVAASVDDTVYDIICRAMEAGLSRIPVYRETIDDVIGFVHVKDLFRLYVNEESSVQKILRQVVYVPESLPVAEVWQKLHAGNHYLAIVFDEYGGTSGLVTFEDLIEEIFGELQDEFDDEMALIARDKAGRIYLRGDLLVADVNEYLELDLPTDAADTLSGLMFSELGRPPAAGDKITVGGTVIRVESMEDLSVSELSLQLPQTGEMPLFSEWEVADHE